MTGERASLGSMTNERGVKELGHVVLYVRDLERSVRFYRDVLGWRQIFPDASVGFPAAMFSGGRTHHELLLIEVGPDAAPIPPGRRIGLYHFGLKVGDTDEELVAMLRTLEDAGVPVGGAADHGMTHSLYIADPDGNEIELYVDGPGADGNDPQVVRAPPTPLRI
jgi:catechol 2,3-dioxygenase